MNKDIAKKTLEMVLDYGVRDCRISIAESTQTSISYLNSEIESLHQSSSSAMKIDIFTEGRFGSFSTNLAEPDEIRPFVHSCIDSCRLLSPDECRMLPPSSLYYIGDGPDLQKLDASFENIPFKAKTDLIEAIDAEVDKSEKRLISTACEYEDCKRSDYLIDSQGLEVMDSGTFFSLYCECTVRGHGEIRPQNGWMEGSLLFRDLKQGCGRKALERTLPMIDARKLASGKYNVVLENTVSKKMVGAIISALNGFSLQQKSSFLLDSLGKQVFPEGLDLMDNPLIPARTGSCLFDSEGVALKQRDIIKDGRICTYFLNTYIANKLKMDRTVEGAFALQFPKHSEMGMEEILRNTGTGILITGFNGGNSNPVTGDFSFGIDGWYFENGQRLFPIKEMNITGNFLSLWNRYLYIGNDPIDYMQWQIPTLAFADADISGI